MRNVYSSKEHLNAAGTSLEEQLMDSVEAEGIQVKKSGDSPEKQKEKSINIAAIDKQEDFYGK